MVLNQPYAQKFAEMDTTSAAMSAMMVTSMITMGKSTYLFTNSFFSCTSGCEIELGYECSGGDHTTADTCTQTEFISGSLAECQAVAGTFLETCSENGGTTAPTFAAMATSSVTCEDNYGGLCIGTKDADDICTWERKLCVTCFKDAATGYVKIRVQTNSFPDHCYYASTNTPIENLIDFEAGFNLQSNLATLPEMAITTQTALDDLLCASAWPELTS